MGCLPKTELKCAVHCPELRPPPPPECHGQDWPRRPCGILTTPLADRRLSIWRDWLGGGLERALGLALPRVLEQRRECLRRDFRPSSGDLPRCLGTGRETRGSSEGECGRGVAAGPVGSEGCRTCLGYAV